MNQVHNKDNCHIESTYQRHDWQRSLSCTAIPDNLFLHDELGSDIISNETAICQCFHCHTYLDSFIPILMPTGSHEPTGPVAATGRVPNSNDCQSVRSGLFRRTGFDPTTAVSQSSGRLDQSLGQLNLKGVCPGDGTRTLPDASVECPRTVLAGITSVGGRKEVSTFQFTPAFSSINHLIASQRAEPSRAEIFPDPSTGSSEMPTGHTYRNNTANETNAARTTGSFTLERAFSTIIRIIVCSKPCPTTKSATSQCEEIKLNAP